MAPRQRPDGNRIQRHLRGTNAAEAKKFSLLDSGLLNAPTCRLLVLNGMEGSIFPVEDSLIVATRGKNKDLIARGNLPHG